MQIDSSRPHQLPYESVEAGSVFMFTYASGVEMFGDPQIKTTDGGHVDLRDGRGFLNGFLEDPSELVWVFPSAKVALAP